MKMIIKKSKKSTKAALMVIKRGHSIDNTANIYSCCRKTQRGGEEEVI